MKNDIVRYVRPFLTEKEEEGSDALVKKVNEFLDGFAWAQGRKNLWVAHSVPGVVGLFLVELSSPNPTIDQYIWVVVGDLPPAYLSSEYAKSPRDALEGYMGEMQAWAEAIEKGEPIDDLIPVNCAPTSANVQALRSRLDFLSRKILPYLPSKLE